VLPVVVYETPVRAHERYFRQMRHHVDDVHEVHEGQVVGQALVGQASDLL